MAAFDYKRKNTAEDLAYKGGLIPDGVMLLEVDRFEFKKNKQTTGAIVAAATLKVLEPEGLKGRLIFLNMNVKHPVEKTQDSGQKEMDRLLEALGIKGDPDDTEELLKIPFTARVGETTPNPNAAPDPNFKPANRIERYYFPGELGVPEIGLAPSPFRKSAPAGGNARRPADNREQRRSGGSDDRGNSRDRDSGGDRGRDSGRGNNDRDRNEGRGGDDRGNDRGRGDESRDRGGNRDDGDRGGRGGNDRNEDMRRDMDDDIPFNEGREERRDEGNGRGNDRPARGGNADSPFARNR